MFALPLINVHRAKRWFSDIVQQKEPLDPECILNTRNSECAVCDEVPVIPQEAKCHHIFCYYCLEVLYFVIKVNNLLSHFNVIGQFSS